MSNRTLQVLFPPPPFLTLNVRLDGLLAYRGMATLDHNRSPPVCTAGFLRLAGLSRGCTEVRLHVALSAPGASKRRA